MMRKFLFIFLSLIILIGFLAAILQPKPKKESFELIKFGASIYPLALVLKDIGQEKIEIIWLSESQGVHEVSLRPYTTQKLSKAKGIFVTGYNLDFWAENLAQKLDLETFRVNEEAPKVLTKEGYLNPHLWLSFSGLNSIAKKMKSILQFFDPQNSSFYQENLNQFLIKLEDLKEEYQKKFEEIKEVPFLTFHDAFVPLFLETKLNYQGSLIVGERELAPKEILDLQDKIKNLGIEIIFNDDYETSPKLINFAKENNLKIFFLDPIESGEVKEGFIFDLMRKNLETIYQSLKNESLGS